MRKINISKKGNITVVLVEKDGVSQILYTSEKRDVKTYLDGVKIYPHPNETSLNNFTISINELVNNFGAKTPEELIKSFINKGFFSGSTNAAKETNEKGNQNNLTKVLSIREIEIEIQGFISSPDQMVRLKQAAVINHINTLNPPLKVEETENLYIKVSRFTIKKPTQG